jgi:hypothetical protein
MPTTLTGLLLFVVLLLPGFAYLVGKERAGTERRASPFRETVAIVSASVTSELFVLVLLSPFWSRALDVDKLVSDPGGYWQERPGLLALWGLLLLLASTGVAYAATRPSIRNPSWGWLEWSWVRKLRERLPWLQSEYPHSSSVSAWWLLFETWKEEGDDIFVGCVLDDGSAVRGSLESFNNSADDNPNRDIVLLPPITYREPNGRKGTDLKCSAVCIPASRIVMMQVSYVSPFATRSEEVTVPEQAAGEAVPAQRP